MELVGFVWYTYTGAAAAATYLTLLAVLLGVLWVSQIASCYIEGRLPALLEQADTPTVFVYLLDLGRRRAIGAWQ